MILYLDTNIVIYAVENPPTHGPLANARMVTARTGGDTFMISDLVRMEALVGPMKHGNVTQEQDYRLFFASSDVAVVPITAAVCDRAARIRATHNFKPMDPPTRRCRRTRGGCVPHRRRPVERLH